MHLLAFYYRKQEPADLESFEWTDPLRWIFLTVYRVSETSDSLPVLHGWSWLITDKAILVLKRSKQQKQHGVSVSQHTCRHTHTAGLCHSVSVKPQGADRPTHKTPLCQRWLFRLPWRHFTTTHHSDHRFWAFWQTSAHISVCVHAGTHMGPNTGTHTHTDLL